LSCTRSHKATSWPKGEKGIRCESGTIPVAVYLNSAFRVWFIAIFATGNNWEGAINGMSQKTYLGAFEGLYLQDTGVNQNCFLSLLFKIKGISYTNWP